MPKTTAAEDAKAVRRCLKGDRSAFDALVTRYRGLAVGVAFSICRRRALAEDVAQDAFIRAYRKLKQLSRHESFCAWLMNIVRNAALRATHNVIRRGEVHRDATVDRGPHVENPTLSLELAEILAKVDAEAQQVLVLKYLHGMTCAEIAGELAVPVGTITSKISRSLGTLRDAAKRETRR
jgi:RNA polymerase sigma-70 factor, ECF subfamily